MAVRLARGAARLVSAGGILLVRGSLSLHTQIKNNKQVVLGKKMYSLDEEKIEQGDFVFDRARKPILLCFYF